MQAVFIQLKIAIGIGNNFQFLVTVILIGLRKIESRSPLHRIAQSTKGTVGTQNYIGLVYDGFTVLIDIRRFASFQIGCNAFVVEKHVNIGVLIRQLKQFYIQLSS